MLGLPLLERRVVLRPRQLVEVPENTLLWSKLLLVQLYPTVLTRSEEKLTVLQFRGGWRLVEEVRQRFD